MNLLVVGKDVFLSLGESGCGKNTLLKSLFPLSSIRSSNGNVEITNSKSVINPVIDINKDKEQEYKETASLRFTEYSQSNFFCSFLGINEFEVAMNINVTMVDGHGDFVDNSDL